MTDAANRTTGGTLVPPTFKGQKWKRRNINLYDAPNVRKSECFLYNKNKGVSNVML